MFLNIVLISLLSLSSVPVYAGSQTTIFEKVSNSPGCTKWFGTILPCALSALSAHFAIQMNKNNPDRKEIVYASRFIRMLSLIIGCFFLDDWFDTDLKAWSLSKSPKSLP